QAIPAHAWALEGVAAVVLADGPGVAELARDDARVAVLTTWVRSGGTLLVTGGSGARFFQGTPLGELLPVDVLPERDEIPAAALSPLGAIADPVPVDRASARPSAHTILAGPGGAPIVAERKLGRGRVVFLAFDPDRPPLRGAKNLGAFLSGL